MRKLKKLEILTGYVPRLYDPTVLRNMCYLINAHSEVINYLVGIIENQQKQIDLLKKMTTVKEGKL